MESISRISSLLETARDLTLEAARDAGPRKTTRNTMPAQQIKKLLDGRTERDVLDGLRRVVAMQYAQPPQPTLPFFAAVLKTLSTPYPSTRPLVYSYLLHHAEADPDTALLAVNTIQKSLADSNPRVRAMALKTMSGIRVPVLSQIVSLAIKRGVGDLSPLVRKAAALSCVKCVRLDPTTRPQVEDYLAILLADTQYYVAGAAIQAFMEICPERIDLVHPVYRQLCKMVVDMDEWGQLATLRLLTVYARRCFPRRTKKVQRKVQSAEDRTRQFYEELDADQDTEWEEVESIDPDLALFLQSIQSLLQSHNSAVILAVASAYLYLSPTSHLPAAIGPLIALLRSPQDIQLIALHNIVQIALVQPSLFLPYTRHFFLRSTDAPDIRRLKLEVLTLTFPHLAKATQDLVLAELEHFSHAHDAELVRDSVHAIGRCAQNSAAPTARRCLTLLLRQIHSADANLVGEAIDVVRHLIQRNPAEHQKTVVRLAKNLDTLTSPTARASVIWLVGEFAAADASDQSIAADVLRLLIRNYADEDDAVKAQIILLAAKVYLHHINAISAKKAALEALNPPLSNHDGQQPQSDDLPTKETQDHPIALLYAHAMLLARYTPSYDLRDRARTYRALLSHAASTDLATLLLLAPKPVPLAPSPAEARTPLVLGSASLAVGESLPGARVDIPDWVADGDEPDPALRKVRSAGDGGDARGAAGSAVSAGRRLDEALRSQGGAHSSEAVGGGPAAAKGKQKTLDDWLDEEETEEEEESEDGSDESSEYETESDSDEDEDEDDEESGNEQSALVR